MDSNTLIVIGYVIATLLAWRRTTGSLLWERVEEARDSYGRRKPTYGDRYVRVEGGWVFAALVVGFVGAWFWPVMLAIWGVRRAARSEGLLTVFPAPPEVRAQLEADAQRERERREKEELADTSTGLEPLLEEGQR